MTKRKNLSTQLKLSKDPQSITQVVGVGIRLWIKSFGLALPFALLIGILNAALQFGMKPYTHALKAAAQDQSQASMVLVEGGHHGALGLITGLAFIVVSLLLFAGMIYRINAAVKNNPMSFDQALFAACRKVLPLIGVYCLTVLMIMVGLFLLVIPGIALMFYLVFAFALVVITDLGVIDSIRESFHLVSGNFWRTVGTMLLILLVYIVVALICGFVLGLTEGIVQASMGGVSEQFKENFTIIISSILVVFMYPLMVTGLLALLYDSQKRKAIRDSEAGQKPTHHIKA